MVMRQQRMWGCVMEETTMRRSLYGVRLGALLAFPTALLALPACGPQPSVSRADETAKPATQPAPAGNSGAAELGTSTTGPRAARSGVSDPGSPAGTSARPAEPQALA